MLKIKILPEAYQWLHNHVTVILINTLSQNILIDKQIEGLQRLEKAQSTKYSEIRKRNPSRKDFDDFRIFLSKNKIECVNGEGILELNKQNYIDLNGSLVQSIKRLKKENKNFSEKSFFVVNLHPQIGVNLIDNIQRVNDLNFCLKLNNADLDDCFELTLFKGKFYIKGTFDKKHENFDKKHEEFLQNFSQKTGSKFINLPESFVIIIEVNENIEDTAAAFIEEFPYNLNANENSDVNSLLPEFK